MTEARGAIAEVVAAIRANQRFVLSSHARPDGDAIGSQLAMAFALDALGKAVTLVNHDPVPSPLKPFPGTELFSLNGDHPRWRRASVQDA